MALLNKNLNHVSSTGKESTTIMLVVIVF